jgi:hypothetical protein
VGIPRGSSDSHQVETALGCSCRLFDLLQDSDDKDAEAEIQQKMSEIAAGIGPEFAAAWAVSEDIDENSPDGQEYYNAIDDVADKCQ